MDESEAYDHGKYETYEKAERAAKEIVNEFFRDNWSIGKTVNDLIGEYCLYGEDPIILPPHPENKNFSARDYALEMATEFCKVVDKEHEKTEIQTLYQDAIKFAAYKHQGKRQKVPGTNLPYVVHLSNVAMEIFITARHTEKFNLSFAVQVALLHDTIEDTTATYDEIKDNFGDEIADAVLALSKKEDLPKEQQTSDSLTRIKKLQNEVWAVKLADRITNLQIPPSTWDIQKRKKYQKEAGLILNELKDGNGYLAMRLKYKIEEYNDFIDDYK